MSGTNKKFAISFDLNSTHTTKLSGSLGIQVKIRIGTPIGDACGVMTRSAMDKCISSPTRPGSFLDAAFDVHQRALHRTYLDTRCFSRSRTKSSATLSSSTKPKSCKKKLWLQSSCFGIKQCSHQLPPVRCSICAGKSNSTTTMLNLCELPSFLVLSHVCARKIG